MTFQPITLEELKELGHRIESVYVVTNTVEDMYEELNTKYGHEEWTLLRAPHWCGDKLVALVVRPRQPPQVTE